MRHGFLGAIAALMAAAGLGSGQEPLFGQPPTDGGFVPGMEGVIGYPPPANPEGFATNDVRKPNVWFNVEYLGWYAKKSKVLYPLVTTGSAAQGGALGSSTTSILFERSTGNEFFSGGRVTGGFFFASDNRFGMQAGGFLLGDGSESYTATSQGSGSPVIARPFVNAGTGVASSYLVSSPATGIGNISVNMETQTWGANLDWVLNLYRSDPQGPWGYNLNFFVGLDVISLRDNIDIVSSSDYFQGVSVPFLGQTFTTGQSIITTQQLIGINPIVFLNTITDSTTQLRVGVVDRIRTSNQFYGGEVGLNSSLRIGRFSLGFMGKIGLGAVHSSVEGQGYSTLFQIADQTITTQRTDIFGVVQSSATARNQLVSPQTGSGGLYVVGNRIGRQAHTTYAYAPEAQLTLSYQFSPTLSASIGYSFLYLSKVVRANQVLNQVVDPALVPTNAAYGSQPATQSLQDFFSYSSYWVQGFNAGLKIEY